MTTKATKHVVSALPPASNTGWGTASRRITEEMEKLALVSDLRGSGVLLNDYPMFFESPLLQAVSGVNMLPMYPHLYGNHCVGYSFCEENLLQRKYALNALRFNHIACGSTWATEQMKEALKGFDVGVSTAIQGVDADVFHPLDDETYPDPEKFTIWSAGKFEYRKAQDVVIRAVGVMMARHKDVHLKTSWWNPWPQSEATMAQSQLIPWRNSQFEACCQYLDMNRVQMIGPEAHGLSVNHINTCDVGLFPNRCEAGTNLPLMEAMSCGLPVLAITSHGHADVTKHFDSRSAIHSKPFIVLRSGMDVAEWYEPELDEVIANLELAYSDRDALPDMGESNRSWMDRFTWAACAQSLLEACYPL